MQPWYVLEMLLFAMIYTHEKKPMVLHHEYSAFRISVCRKHTIASIGDRYSVHIKTQRLNLDLHGLVNFIETSWVQCREIMQTETSLFLVKKR